MDDYRYSSGALASWCFWGENQPKVAKIRQLDPHSDHNRDHTRCIESAWSGVTAVRLNQNS